jgi:parvulin-like peptidyl-prolyl cis-trans isomerase-like protein
MQRTVLVMLALVVGCEDKYQKMQEQAAASASAQAAASAAALASALAVASTTPSAPASVKKEEAPPEWITAQHVLVAYKGAAKCPHNVTRSKDEARKRADEVRAKAVDGKMDFGDIAAMYSDDPNGKERQGSLGKIFRTSVVKEFGDAAWALKVDEVSNVVETQFGFHVIKRNQ